MYMHDTYCVPVIWLSKHDANLHSILIFCHTNWSVKLHATKLTIKWHRFHNVTGRFYICCCQIVERSMFLPRRVIVIFEVSPYIVHDE